MAPGSFADVPQGLRREIEQLERQFSVDTEKLKLITDHFVTELDKGLWQCCSFRYSGLLS